jgi:hypothetical protein
MHGWYYCVIGAVGSIAYFQDNMRVVDKWETTDLKYLNRAAISFACSLKC